MKSNSVLMLNVEFEQISVVFCQKENLNKSILRFEACN